MKHATLMVLFVALGLGACAPVVNVDSLPSHSDVLTESVCSLTGHAPPPSGVRVRITAFYITDYSEHSRLADPSCRSSRVDFSFSPGAVGPQGSDAYKELESIILHDFVGSHRTGVYRISFTGRFVYRKSLDPHAMVDISRVWSFERLPCTAFYAAAECKGID